MSNRTTKEFLEFLVLFGGGYLALNWNLGLYKDYRQLLTNAAAIVMGICGGRFGPYLLTLLKKGRNGAQSGHG